MDCCSSSMSSDSNTRFTANSLQRPKTFRDRYTEKGQVATLRCLRPPLTDVVLALAHHCDGGKTEIVGVGWTPGWITIGVIVGSTPGCGLGLVGCIGIGVASPGCGLATTLFTTTGTVVDTLCPWLSTANSRSVYAPFGILDVSHAPSSEFG